MRSTPSLRGFTNGAFDFLQQTYTLQRPNVAAGPFNLWQPRPTINTVFSQNTNARVCVWRGSVGVVVERINRKRQIELKFTLL